MLLSGGHEGEIYCAKFHPEGNILASAGFDRTISRSIYIHFLPYDIFFYKNIYQKVSGMSMESVRIITPFAQYIREPF